MFLVDNVFEEIERIQQLGYEHFKIKMVRSFIKLKMDISLKLKHPKEQKLKLEIYKLR